MALTIRVPLSITIGDIPSGPVAEIDLPLDYAKQPAAIAGVLRALADHIEGVPDAAARQ